MYSVLSGSGVRQSAEVEASSSACVVRRSTGGSSDAAARAPVQAGSPASTAMDRARASGAARDGVVGMEASGKVGSPIVAESDASHD